MANLTALFPTLALSRSGMSSCTKKN